MNSEHFGLYTRRVETHVSTHFLFLFGFFFSSALFSAFG